MGVMPAPIKIPLFDSTSPFERHAGGGLFSFGDFAEAMRRVPVRQRSHRHDHLELFWFAHGEGRHSNDLHEFPVAAPCFVFVDVGHVHSWPDHARLEGVRLSFSSEFARCAHSGAAAVFGDPQPVVIPASPERAARVSLLLGQIGREWGGREDGEYLCAIRDLLSVVLLEARRAHREAGAPEHRETPASRLYREFREVAERNLRADFGVAEAAAKLGVSADHLSAVTRERSGRSAGFLLRSRLLLEARRLLVHSRLSVAEIGHYLGYEDPSYFGKVFSKEEGVSPGEFRRMHVSGDE